MQFTTSFILALCLTAAQGARFRRGSRSTQAGKMNPQAVAHTLVEVEDKWMHQATAFAGCNASDASFDTCKDGTMGEFVKSCTTVVRAIVEGSSGDKSDVKEYLDDICGQSELQGWKEDMCGNLTIALNNALTEDGYANREELDFNTICSGFITKGFLKKAVEEEKVREEQERKREEEEEKEAKARAEEEAKAEAAKAKAAEAQAKADAAKKAAEEAAQKRAEAQAKAAEAQRKDAEAAEAEAHANVTVAEAKATAAAAANATATNASVPANATDAKPEQATVNTSVPTATTKAESNATQTATSAPKPSDKNVTLLIAKRALAVNTSAPAKATVNASAKLIATKAARVNKNITKHD